MNMNNNIVLIIIVIVILVGISIGVLMWQSQQLSEPFVTPTALATPFETPVVQSPSPTPTPYSDAQIKSELDTMVEQDINTDKEFKDIDSDIQNL